ncbi:MAG: CDP-alcohol phosphatidyltransferase family protein [Anaerolineae bacterium]
MFTAWLRKVAKVILDPLADGLVRLGLSANAVTLTGCIGTILVSVFLVAQGRFLWGGILFALFSAVDALDGTLARRSGGPTAFGSFLDSVLDRVSESALLLALAWWYLGQDQPVYVILAYVALVGSLLVSYARAKAESLDVECRVGLFTRVERCIVLVAGMVLHLTGPMLWILAVGATATALHRVIHVYSHSKGKLLAP